MDFSNITIKDQLYTLTTTENKRQLIFKDGILVGTKPFIIDTITKNSDKLEQNPTSADATHNEST
jgi:hypothetical protein